MLSNLQRDNTKVFSWSYPDSWEKPCSFYGLNFQYRVVRHNLPCDSDAPILVSEHVGDEYSSFELFTTLRGLF